MSYGYSYTNDILYNGEKITVVCQQYESETGTYRRENLDRIAFTYKDIRVVEFIKNEKIMWERLVRLMCDIIDKLGEEKFNTFKEYYDEITSLSERFIIIDDKVYKPCILGEDGSLSSGELHYYAVSMKMADNKSLNGRTNFNEDGMNPFDKEEANKDVLIENLRYKVRNYYKENNILPNEKYILPKKTEKLKGMLAWLDSNKINLKWLYED